MTTNLLPEAQFVVISLDHYNWLVNSDLRIRVHTFCPLPNLMDSQSVQTDSALFTYPSRYSFAPGSWDHRDELHSLLLAMGQFICSVLTGSSAAPAFSVET